MSAWESQRPRIFSSENIAICFHLIPQNVTTRYDATGRISRRKFHVGLFDKLIKKSHVLNLQGWVS